MVSHNGVSVNASDGHSSSGAVQKSFNCHNICDNDSKNHKALQRHRAVKRLYNLSSYPFFSNVPPEEDIHFKCDGLHDGFYASIEHKCQVYHHCVYGIRHDFLCANFTAFDQRTFICHFVSDVDCEGSKNYWNRNDDLYMATNNNDDNNHNRAAANAPQTVKEEPVAAYDDYYEEPRNRRRKPRPRQRKPIAEYEKNIAMRSHGRRHNPRDHLRDEEELEEVMIRKSTTAAGRLGADERRSLSEDRPLAGRKDKSRITPSVEPADPVEPPPRRLNDYAKPHEHAPDQEEAAEEEAPPKVKTTPNHWKNSLHQSRYWVCLCAPTSTTTPESTHASEDDYYEEEVYDDIRLHRVPPRRRVVDSKLDEEEEVPSTRRRNQNDTPLIKNLPEQPYDDPQQRKSLIWSTRGRGADDVDFVDDDYEERPLRPANRLRPKAAARKGTKKPRRPIEEEMHQCAFTTIHNDYDTAATIEESAADAELDEEEENNQRPSAKSTSRPLALWRTATVRVVKRPFLPSRGGSPYLPHSTPIDMGSTISGVRLLEHGAPILRDSGSATAPMNTHIVHDPNGYEREREQPQPKITLDELYENDYDVTLNDALNPTLKPLSQHHSNHPNHHSAYENAYASESGVVKHKLISSRFNFQIITIAIHHQSEHMLAQQQQQQQQQTRQQPQQPRQQHQQQSAYNDYNSDDSYFSPTDIRRRAVIAAPQQPYSSRTDYRSVGMRIAQHFYDDLEY
ncbi:unnamed protein product [Ceratitis capitata]|uniref:(Mediterranean fruit fly) hypothetical protein n=1 Tax=Ceratitis capitata TaxID=7213 RepID=A0A811V1L0_CERCA|nr:unnamed protein product [Ceratitis capitata]